MLTPHTSGKGQVSVLPDGWRLHLPPQAGGYALAQVDDYAALPRAAFPHPAGLRLSVRVRASQAGIPGTWGFGLWNDPFSLSLGLGGGVHRFPALPNAAWFFFASPPNHLSFRDDQPGCGALASMFTAPRIPAPLLGAAAPLLGAALWPPAGRLLRRAAARLIQQDNRALQVDITQWHTCQLQWTADGVTWEIDGQTVHTSPGSPRPPLGLVLWLDNQFAAWGADGRLRWGILALKQAVTVEIRDFTLLLLDNTGRIV